MNNLLTTCLSLLCFGLFGQQLDNFEFVDISSGTDVNTSQTCAQEFTTGPSSFINAEITVVLKMNNVVGSPSNFQVGIYNETGGNPNALIFPLNGNNDPSTQGDYTYTGTVSLDPNTSYFIVASATGGLGHRYSWMTTTGTSINAIDGFTSLNKIHFTSLSSWSTSFSNFRYAFQLAVSTPPNFTITTQVEWDSYMSKYSNTIQPGHHLTIQTRTGVMIMASGEITNNGTITNKNGSTFVNKGTINQATGSAIINEDGGTIENSGNIVNQGSITNSGVINNKGGIISNHSMGTLTNDMAGIIESSGTFSQLSGSMFINKGIFVNKAIGTPLTNGKSTSAISKINNSGNIVNSGDINNENGSSIFNQSGGDITNQDGGLITNFNNGTITNQSGSLFTNQSGGTIFNENGANINIEGGSTFKNFDCITNDGIITNSGMTINYMSGAIKPGFIFLQTTASNKSTSGILNNGVIYNYGGINNPVTNNNIVYNCGTITGTVAPIPATTLIPVGAPCDDGDSNTTDDVITMANNCASCAGTPLPAAPIPTLSQWGLILLSMSLSILGIVGIRQRVLA